MLDCYCVGQLDSDIYHVSAFQHIPILHAHTRQVLQIFYMRHLGHAVSRRTVPSSLENLLALQSRIHSSTFKIHLRRWSSRPCETIQFASIQQ